MNRETTISKVTAIAERVAAPLGFEIVDVELKGSGRNHLLRVYIDKPEGVTHGNCETFSRDINAVLDAEDPIPGSYDLEVSSPGVERKLGKWQDWERFAGKKVKVILKDPQTGSRHVEGEISRAADRTVTLTTPSGELTFPFEQIDRANLKFEW